MHDALLFRAARYATASPDEVNREPALDVKEGIPEYTGWKLSDSPRAAFITSVDSAPARLESFIRAFVYYAGPAYAMLLDDYTNGSWRKSLGAHPDLQSMLVAEVASRQFANDDLIRSELAAISAAPARRSALLASAARIGAQRYGGAAIAAAEKQRSKIRDRQLAEYRAEFIDGPTVRLRPHTLSVSFNPRGQSSLGNAGTVMANLSWKSGDGSSLAAPAGALINQDWAELRVPLGDAHIVSGIMKKETTFTGTGWTLVLAPGWMVSADGSSIVVSPPAGG